MNDKCEKYTIQLYNFIEPHIFEGLKSIYDTATKKFSSNVLVQFQTMLKSIPTWKPELLEQEVKRIRNESKLDTYLDKLFNVTILLNILVMTSIPESKKESIQIPKDITFEKFIHNTYIYSAESIYSDPRIFTDIVSNYEKIKSIIISSIDKAIQVSIPIKVVLDLYEKYETETKSVKNIIVDNSEKIYSIKKPNDNLEIKAESIINKPPIISHPRIIQQTKKMYEPIKLSSAKNAPVESEAYYNQKAPLDVFSNSNNVHVGGGKGTEYKGTEHKGSEPREMNNKGTELKGTELKGSEHRGTESKSETPDVNTVEIEKYALGYNKNVKEMSDSNSSRYVPQNNKKYNIKI